MAGYSGTPLAKKLGIKQGHRVGLHTAPEGFPAALGDLPEGVAVGGATGAGPLDLILAFFTDRAMLAGTYPRLKASLPPAGVLWVAWPKKASKVKTDLTEDVVRDVGLAAGLVDVKVCAIDEVWSGLKFVTRLEDRPSTKV
jgi:hypothetical protein